MGFFAITFMKLMQTGDTTNALFMVVLTGFVFHFMTLEEYYTGSLIMPPCNIVSDGSVFFISGFVFMGIYGNSFWLNDVTIQGHTMKINEALELFMIFGSII